MLVRRPQARVDLNPDLDQVVDVVPQQISPNGVLVQQRRDFRFWKQYKKKTLLIGLRIDSGGVVE